MPVLTILLLLLSGCATGVFDPRACPQERKYTQVELNRLADEVDRAGPATKSAMVDYGKLRDKARACRGQR